MTSHSEKTARFTNRPSTEYVAGWLQEYRSLRTYAALRAYRRAQDSIRDAFTNASGKFGPNALQGLIQGAGGWDAVTLGIPPALPSEPKKRHVRLSTVIAVGWSLGLALWGLNTLASGARRAVERLSEEYGAQHARVIVRAAGGWDVLTMGAPPSCDELSQSGRN